MIVTPSGREVNARLEQPEKTFVPIVFNDAGSFLSARLVHPLNALLAILVTVDGNCTSVTVVTPRRTSGTVVTADEYVITPFPPENVCDVTPDSEYSVTCSGA